MPRPNPPRSIAGEQSLARRVAHERESRGMSYEGLASRMANVGCPINASAIYKIEKAEPPRRITVDELVAFSQVFDVPIDQLLWPPEVAASRELGELVISWNEALEAAGRAHQEERERWERLMTYVAEHPEIADKLEELMEIWVQFHYEEEHRPTGLPSMMFQLTGSDEWGRRMAAALEEATEVR